MLKRLLHNEFSPQLMTETAKNNYYKEMKEKIKDK